MIKNVHKGLKKGDLIDIIAPGSKSPLEVISGAKKNLSAIGYKVRIEKDIFSNENPFHSNSDNYRFKDLVKALNSNNSKVIWCLRGGYGCNRLLPKLAKIKRPKKPKILLGYSDITSLHVFFNQNWNWPSYHAINIDRFALKNLTKAQEKEIFAVLTGTIQEVEFKNLKPLNKSAVKKNNITSSVVGGNFTVLQSTLGTPWQIDTKNKILFLEEIEERGYRIDRMFEHFLQSGALKGCRAIVLGDFVGGKEPDGRALWKQAVQRFASQTSIPVFSGMKTGHGKGQRVVPFNTKAKLITGKKATLYISTGVSRV